MLNARSGSPSLWTWIGWIIQIIGLVAGTAAVSRVVVQIDFNPRDQSLSTGTPSSTAPAIAVAPRTAPTPVPTTQSAQSFPLLSGKLFSLDVRGDRVEVWSDGIVEAAADGGRFETLQIPGKRLRFTRGASRVHIHPLDARATLIFVRKLSD